MADKKKQFLVELGERSADTGSTDTLLKARMDERAAKKVEQAEEIDELEHEAKKADLQKKVAAANPPEESPGSKKVEDSNAGFKVTGGVHLGNIDLDEQRKQREAELGALKKEQNEAIKAMGVQNEQLRDQIQSKEIENVRLAVQNQLDVLTKMSENNAAQGDFAQQMERARATAAAIGYTPPSPGGTGNDIMAQIELSKVEFNNTLALRKFEEEAKDRAVDRQIQIAKINGDKEDREAERARQEKRDEYFAKAPEVIGRVLGQALREGPEGGIGAQPQDKARSSSQPHEPQPGLTAGVGESGIVTCTCGTEMAIGPTATLAVCSSCNKKHPIVREENPDETTKLEPEEE